LLELLSQGFNSLLGPNGLFDNRQKKVSEMIGLLGDQIGQGQWHLTTKITSFKSWRLFKLQLLSLIPDAVSEMSTAFSDQGGISSLSGVLT
jgi:hypothetical protein